MAALINLCLQGTVYLGAHRSLEDDDMLQLLSTWLVGLTRVSTFDILYSHIAHNWYQQDDLVTFSNDHRWNQVETIWTFDLDRDILQLDKRDRKLWVSLKFVRQHPITIYDFEPYDPPPTVAKHRLQSVYRARCWNMPRKYINPQRLRRRQAFVARILADFAFQWRHILCGRYNNFTFRRLANAIVRIVTLNFNVGEVTSPRPGLGGALVRIYKIPEWSFASGHIFNINGTSIVMCQHAPLAIKLIRDDFAKQALSNPGLAEKGLTYLIISVRELVLYRINRDYETCTEPKHLFDGMYPPSHEAIELLLQATHTRAPRTPLCNLPIDLQDAILDKVSAGPIERARVGCLLDVGSVFTWRCGNRNIQREEGRPFRTPWTPVESHIFFGGCHSGVAYK